jgi:hypothetical protein
MFKRMFLTVLGFLIVAGGFWALQAQDPAPQKPSTTMAQTTVQTDLSGTYAGTFNCDALGLTGDTTLTINGNEFTTADGKTGRIVASTTHGYTAVALQLGGTGTATPAGTPTIVSLRARKSGNRLTLMSVPGATMKCTFTPGRNVARNRRNRPAPATPPTATGTEVSSPAAVPSAVPTESPVPAQTPSPSPTPRRSPRPRPTPTPSASPTPSPEPMPSPTPAPEPVPSPTPGEPTPSPSPEASPSPTPSPSPSPRLQG